MKPLQSYFELAYTQLDAPIINEHLKTLEPKVVLRQLNAKFAMGPGMDIKFQGASNYDVKTPAIQLIAPEQLSDYVDDLRMELDLMMWCLTKYWTEGGLFIFQIEPIQANQCNDYVYKECGGIIYHLTSRISAARILGSGLRGKGHSYERGEYRSMPTRTYFITGKDPNDVRSAIDEVRRSFGKGAGKLSTILKIDLTSYGKNLEFYRDVMYDIPNTIFAYSNIPGALIEEVDYNDI